jgi:hypothetical protein
VPDRERVAGLKINDAVLGGHHDARSDRARRRRVDRIVKTIAVFDDFCQANDPYEEHDFGAFDVDGHTIMFKIDYLDRDSPDPADPSVTQRVITIMLAEEY